MTDSLDRTRRAILRHGILLPASYLVAHTLLPMVAFARPGRWAECGMQVFVHRESARVIGQRFLESEPAAPRLISAVVERLQRQSDLRTARSDQELVMTALTSDYHASRVVEVDGWILSETEVVFCALATFGES